MDIGWIKIKKMTYKHKLYKLNSVLWLLIRAQRSYTTDHPSGGATLITSHISNTDKMYWLHVVYMVAIFRILVNTGMPWCGARKWLTIYVLNARGWMVVKHKMYLFFYHLHTLLYRWEVGKLPHGRAKSVYSIQLISRWPGAPLTNID